MDKVESVKRYYHYTCSHQVEQIRASGVLRPWPQPVLGGIELIWLTDMDVPERAALGLTSNSLHCDRTEHRIAVECDALRWVRWCRRLPIDQRRTLEYAPGAMPMHWWLTLDTVPVVEVT